jgi:hypothetical protein
MVAVTKCSVTHVKTNRLEAIALPKFPALSQL